MKTKSKVIIRGSEMYIVSEGCQNLDKFGFRDATEQEIEIYNQKMHERDNLVKQLFNGILDKLNELKESEE